ncbi:PGF-CTERM sorting domain-containing protein [Halobellus rubicundus]|uniref:PGF-CTERM sorting domain-containing protein n=1 Tax=Halobellus rubicundus TaxID=2996466 RepID=A0ABD5MCQ7_9EURY
MKIRQIPRVGILLCVLLLLTVTIPGASGTDGGDYGITLNESVDIPERTLETDSENYTVASIGRYVEGETVTVRTDGPENTSYAVRLVDSRERSRMTAYVAGNGSRQFPLAGYEPGTYAVVITNESDADTVYDVKLLVVSGYTVTHLTPSEIEHNTTLSVEFRLRRASEGVAESPEEVEVAIGNGSMSIRTEATRTFGLNYTAEIDTRSLAPGEYQLYTGVQRNDTVYGYKEFVGVDTYRVTVVDSSASTTTEAPQRDSDTAATTTITTTTSTGTPGFGPLPALVALGGVVLLARMRRVR